MMTTSSKHREQGRVNDTSDDSKQHNWDNIKQTQTQSGATNTNDKTQKKDSDNVKQDMSIDVYGREGEEGEEDPREVDY